MDSETNAVLSFVHRQLQIGQPCWLVTVVSTWGSAPRLPGACLAWSEAGGSCGSLSGGCVEEDLIRKLAIGQFNNHTQPFMHTYGISAAEAAHYGLPCGGRLELLLEYLPVTPHHQQHFARIDAAINQRQGLVRQIALQHRFDSAQVCTLSPSSPQPLHADDQQVGVYIGPRYRLVIIGANQVAQYLAEFTRTLDFDVWVCDPREDAFTNWPLRFTENFQHMPDDLIRERGNDCFTAVVAVAHDPRVDDMALMEALTSNCFYVGAMGSQRSSAARKARLQELGITPQQMARLVAPIGLAIGSKTPAEIAMAIAADLVRAIRCQ